MEIVTPDHWNPNQVIANLLDLFNKFASEVFPKKNLISPLVIES